jgi:hypothetical protein
MGIATIVFIVLAMLVSLGVLVVTVRTSRRQEDAEYGVATRRPARRDSRTPSAPRGTSRTGRAAERRV